MVPVEAHLALNHIPLVGLIFGVAFFVAGLTCSSPAPLRAATTGARNPDHGHDARRPTRRREFDSSGYFVATGQFRLSALGVWEPWFYLGAILFGLSTLRALRLRE